MNKDFSMKSILDITKDRKPDFNNILKILKCEKPDRPTLFDFYLNEPLERRATGWRPKEWKNDDEDMQRNIKAFQAFGYDYVNFDLNSLTFKFDDSREVAKTVSANTGYVITDRESFETYEWDKPLNHYDGKIERCEKFLPDGMKFMASAPGGILENVTRLIGYDNMCYMLMDEPDLVKDIFDKVGQCFYDYYSIAVKYDSVGMLMVCDDWGFNTQTMFAPDTLREYLFPWVKKITGLAHAAGKPAVLHSCGNLTAVWDDIIDDMKFQGKHSYEDNICPVEEMYDILDNRIAVLGGIDIDYIARRTPEEIYERSLNLLKKTECKGYALGTGNSVPDYIPDENYFAMLGAVLYNG